MLDELLKNFEADNQFDKNETPKFAVIGRPNVGKSSFINSLIGKEQNIVTNIAGTTRDSLNTKFTQFGFDFTLVDTAGLRKKKNVSEDLEFYSVMRSVRAIEHSDICIHIIDAERGFEAQDQRIFHIADRNKKGILILVNKWDLLDKSTETAKKIEDQIRKNCTLYRCANFICFSIRAKKIIKIIRDCN